jgi:YHS domain-containing protein
MAHAKNPFHFEPDFSLLKVLLLFVGLGLSFAIFGQTEKRRAATFETVVVGAYAEQFQTKSACQDAHGCDVENEASRISVDFEGGRFSFASSNIKESFDFLAIDVIEAMNGFVAIRQRHDEFGDYRITIWRIKIENGHIVSVSLPNTNGDETYIFAGRKTTMENAPSAARAKTNVRG